MNFSHLKRKCAGCLQDNPDTDREHVYPQWLIRRTNSKRSAFRWYDSDGDEIRVSPLSITLPLCKKCNNDFANHLETPVDKLVAEIEAGKGINDYEAELLIRWIWKTTGLVWVARNPNMNYTGKYTLKQRCLNPIDEIRGSLVLGIALIEKLDEESTDWPLGFYKADKDAIFGSGVFSRIALVIARDDFAHLLPQMFTQYKLNPARITAEQDIKVLFPKIGFQDDVAAVQWTRAYSQHLMACHDWFGRIQYIIHNVGVETYLKEQVEHNRILVITFFIGAQSPPLLETWIILDHADGKTAPKIQEYIRDLMLMQVSGDARAISPANTDGYLRFALRTDINLHTLETFWHSLTPSKPIMIEEIKIEKSWYDVLISLTDDF